MEKIVVVGGSGFIGSHVVDLLDRKGFKVIIFDINKSRYLKNNYTMIVGDILDEAAIRKAVKDASVVYHFAGVVDIEQSYKSPLNTMNINLIGTCNVLEACRKENVRRFIFASSIYTCSSAGSFYKVSKLACEKLIEEYNKAFDLNYTILRIGSTYGPRASDLNIFKKMISQALTDGRITCKDTRDRLREYINVEDVATACVHILSSEYKNRHIVLKGNQMLSMGHCIDIIKELFNNEITVDFIETENHLHYNKIPYSYQPNRAVCLRLNHYHDLGDGLLDVIHEFEDGSCND